MKNEVKNRFKRIVSIVLAIIMVTSIAYVPDVQNCGTHKKTLEYLVYDKETKKIITYFLPKHSSYNAQHYSQWAQKALKYALKYIAP